MAQAEPAPRKRTRRGAAAADATTSKPGADTPRAARGRRGDVHIACEASGSPPPQAGYDRRAAADAPDRRDTGDAWPQLLGA